MHIHEYKDEVLPNSRRPHNPIGQGNCDSHSFIRTCKGGSALQHTVVEGRLPNRRNRPSAHLASEAFLDDMTNQLRVRIFTSNLGAIYERTLNISKLFENKGTWSPTSNIPKKLALALALILKAALTSKQPSNEAPLAVVLTPHALLVQLVSAALLVVVAVSLAATEAEVATMQVSEAVGVDVIDAFVVVDALADVKL